jgi:hypothetical protein
MFIGMGATAILQPALIAVAVLQDRSTVPVFPRWVGWLNVWTVLLFLPGPFCVFFKTGPLAWDGIFPWWIPFIVFALWMVIMIVVVHQSINRTTRAGTPFATVDPELLQQVTQIVDDRLSTLRRDLEQSAIHRN